MSLVGSLLKEIKKQVLWVPIIKRTPSIRSIIIENIRNVLYENNDYRKKFLNKIGKRIYEGYTRERKHEWVRVSFLGSGREVGRSCLLLQTQESRILMDCGINVAASENDAYPMLDAPEFKLEDVDAIIATHAHIDHIAMIPLLYKYGFTGPTYATEPVRDIMALLCLDYIEIAQKEAKKAPYSSSDIKNMVKLIKGADKYFLQNFRRQADLVGQEFSGRSFSLKAMAEFKNIAAKYVKVCEVR